MRTALLMLKRNEEVPPQLRAALDNLATETLPDLLGGIVHSSQQKIVQRMDEQYAKSDDDFRSLQTSVFDGTERIESSVDKKHKETVSELDRNLRVVTESLGNIGDALNESLPSMVEAAVRKSTEQSVADLKSELLQSRDSHSAEIAALGASLSESMREEFGRNHSDVMTAVDAVAVKVPDALDGRLQRLRQRMLSSIAAELQELCLKLRSDIVRDVAQEFDRMQQASDELVAQRLREVAMEQHSQ